VTLQLAMSFLKEINEYTNLNQNFQNSQNLQNVAYCIRPLSATNFNFHPQNGGNTL